MLWSNRFVWHSVDAHLYINLFLFPLYLRPYIIIIIIIYRRMYTSQRKVYTIYYALRTNNNKNSALYTSRVWVVSTYLLFSILNILRRRAGSGEIDQNILCKRRQRRRRRLRWRRRRDCSTVRGVYPKTYTCTVLYYIAHVTRPSALCVTFFFARSRRRRDNEKTRASVISACASRQELRRRRRPRGQTRNKRRWKPQVGKHRYIFYKYYAGI